MKAPPFLKAGDKISIVATARKVSPGEMQPAIHALNGLGFEVVPGKNLFSENHQYAGSDRERLQDFQAALDNKNIKAILFARGGYGTVRIIDKIDFSGFIKNPKWLAGFSDVTVIHTHVHNLNVETLHAPMAINFSGMSAEVLTALDNILCGHFFEVTTGSTIYNRNGKASGRLIGGNLSLLHTLNHTASDISFDNKILFIEDLDEYLYHIDRMMMNLKRTGKLKSLAGLIVGGMTEMKDNIIPFGKKAEEIIRDAVEEFDYPVCFNFPSGHIKENYPLIFGRQVHLTVDEKVALQFEEVNGKA